jgi:lysyl-tRNA synthetase class 2
MKPEVQLKGSSEGSSELKAGLSKEKEDVELTDDEKAVNNLLKVNSPIDLNELKGQTGLSNKKWDKAIKGLTKNKLARVEKTDVGLLVSVV